MRKYSLLAFLLVPFLLSGCAGGGGGGGLSSSGSPASGLGPASSLSNSLRLTVSWPQGKALPPSATTILVNVVDLAQWSPEQGRPEIVNPNAIKARAQAARQGDTQTIVVTAVPTGLFWIDVTALDSSGNRVAGSYTVMRLTDAGADLAIEVFPKIFWGNITTINRHDSWAKDLYYPLPTQALRLGAGYATPDYDLVSPPAGSGVDAYLNSGSLGSLPYSEHQDTDKFGNPVSTFEKEGSWGTGVYEFRPSGKIPGDYSSQPVRVAFEGGKSLQPTTFVKITDGTASAGSPLDATKPIYVAWNPVPGAVQYRLQSGWSDPSGNWIKREWQLSGTEFQIPENTFPSPGNVEIWVHASRWGAESWGEKARIATQGGNVTVTVNPPPRQAPWTKGGGW
ncbi:MAG: hypothetical protein HYU64_09270 [Armatimonadetes bacterium]|nr:hypothetical protein [Armatimonadota bacterium]